MVMPKKHYLKKELDELIKSDIFIFEFIESSSLDGIWYWDIENIENQWMSERFWTILGYDPKQKEHKAIEWQKLVHEDDLKQALDNLNKHLEDASSPYDQIIRYRHADGSIAWIRCRGLAIRDENGKPIRMVGTHNDLTMVMDSLKKVEKYYGLSRLNEDLTKKYNEEYNNRLEAQKTNRDNERYFNIINRFVISLNLDLQGNILSVSDAFCKVSGYSKEEVIGKPYISLLYPNTEEEFFREIKIS